MIEERPKLQYVSENSYFYHVIIALIPMIFYGIYKNGLLPYFNHDSSWMMIFKPLIFSFLGFLGGYFVDFYMHIKQKKKIIFKYSIYGLVIALAMPFQANLFVFVWLLIFYFFCCSFFHKLPVSPFWVGMVLFLFLFGNIFQADLRNSTEISNVMVYSMSDIFFGRTVGGICNTSILCSLLSFFFLCFDPFFKKEISISYLVSYVILTVVFEIFLPSGDLLKSLLNFSVFYSSFFCVTEMYYSPYMDTGKVLFGVLGAVCSFFCTRFISTFYGAYLGVMIVGFFSPICNVISIKIHEKKEKFCRIGHF